MPPVITSVSPSMLQAAGGEIIAVAGSGFNVNCVIEIDGVAQDSNTTESPALITAVSKSNTAGPKDISVTDTIELTTDTVIDGVTFCNMPYNGAAAIFEKNKLATRTGFITLLELSGEGMVTRRVCKNTKSIIWNNKRWLPYPFVLDAITEAPGETPSIKVQVSNVTREIQAALEELNGPNNAIIKVYLVHTAHLGDEAPVWESAFSVQTADCNNEFVTFTCGLGYSPMQRRPIFKTIKYMCTFRYADIHCGVSAATKTTYPLCNHTLTDCEERGNESRFGGEISIPGGYFG